VILADTSVWVEHLRSGDARLAALLHAGRVVGHALVVAEIALGSLRDRSRVLSLLDGLPSLPVARGDEVRILIEHRRLFGRGIGFVDVSLLASCMLAPGTSIWTRDRKLDAVAGDLGLSHK
jgi:predicted nucleic acid-binding protein